MQIISRVRFYRSYPVTQFLKQICDNSKPKLQSFSTKPNHNSKPKNLPISNTKPNFQKLFCTPLFKTKRKPQFLRS